MQLPPPPKTTGRSLSQLLSNPKSEGHPAFGYYGSAQTIRTDQYRLIVHRDKTTELYDFTDPAKEAINVAEQNTDVVNELTKILKERMELK